MDGRRGPPPANQEDAREVVETNRTLLACTAAVGLSLYFLYATVVVEFLRHLDLSTVVEVELVVIITQAMRVSGAAAYYRGKPPKLEVLTILFSIDALVVTGLIGASLATSDQSYVTFGQTVFSTWVASLFTILPAYLTFALVAEMARDRNLVAVLLPAGVELSFLVFLATTLAGSGGSFSLAGFFDFLVSPGRLEVPGIYAVSLLVSSVAVYCALLVYSTIPTATTSVQPRVNFVLPLMGAALSLGWVYSAVLILPNSLLSFTLPGLALVALLWVYMRR